MGEGFFENLAGETALLGSSRDACACLCVPSSRLTWVRPSGGMDVLQLHKTLAAACAELPGP